MQSLQFAFETFFSFEKPSNKSRSPDGWSTNQRAKRGSVRTTIRHYRCHSAGASGSTLSSLYSKIVVGFVYRCWYTANIAIIFNGAV